MASDEERMHRASRGTRDEEWVGEGWGGDGRGTADAWEQKQIP